MAAIINLAFDDDEDFVFPLKATDRNGNAVDMQGNYVLLVRPSLGSNTVSLQLGYTPIGVNIGSPTSFPGISFPPNQPVRFGVSPGGSLPTGLLVQTASEYYVKSPGTSPFQISNSPGGASINTSGSLVGTCYLIAGVDATDGINGNVIITFPYGFLSPGTYVYDLIVAREFYTKILKGTITVTKGMR